MRYRFFIQTQMTEQNYPQLRYTPKQVTAEKKPGMDSLMNIVLDIKRDVKRVKSAIAPQNAEAMIQKHNQSSPNSPWYLNKRDPNGPAVLANLTDVNGDDIPDVIVYDKRGNPLIVNGWTTKKSEWADDLVYNTALPTRAARAQVRNQRGKSHVDAHGNEVKVYSKRDFLRDQFNPQYFGYDDATSQDLVENVGRVRLDTSYYDQNFPFYKDAVNSKRYTSTAPKNLSAYAIFKKYLFQPAFDDAAAIVETSIGRALTGPEKLKFIGKLSSKIWNQSLKSALDPHNTLTKKEFDKLKRSENGKASTMNMVRAMISAFKDNTNTHAYDGVVNFIVSEINTVVGGVRVVGANPGEYVMGPSEFNTSAAPPPAPFSDTYIDARLAAAADEDAPIDPDTPMPGFTYSTSGITYPEE